MWSLREFFPRSRPRAAKGGIKAQSKRGKFGESWWARRWVEVLESFEIGARLGRGRSYARNGQVLTIDVTKGKVKAKVQGSRPKPYDITIQVKSVSPADWSKVVAALSRQALYTAKLLAGEMPQDIEEVFRQAKVSLFPKELDDLTTDCSCPDWSNPCKHIAAVYYLLGEEFDRDPFLIFRLRGLEREELLKRLGAGERVKKAKKVGSDRLQPVAESRPDEPDAYQPGEPLPSDPTTFWTGGKVPEDLGEVRIPSVSAALPKRLGNFPFWRGVEHFLDSLTPRYRHAAEQGMALFLGAPSGDGE